MNSIRSTVVRQSIGLVAIAAMAGCAVSQSRVGSPPGNDWDGFGVIIGQLIGAGAGVDTIPIAINGVGSGGRTSADGRFVVRTNQRTVALSFPATYDTLRLRPVRLEPGDTLVLALLFYPRVVDPLLPPIVPTPPPGVDVYFGGSFSTRLSIPMEPLWVVDGVAIPETLPDLSKVRASRMEMARGAAMASQYGSRAAGGVVFVTSRRR